MKSIVNTSKGSTHPITYPCLMTVKEGQDDAGTIVLFTAAGEGVVLVPHGKNRSTGETFATWDNEGDFALFDGSITLEND